MRQRASVWQLADGCELEGDQAGLLRFPPETLNADMLKEHRSRQTLPTSTKHAEP